MRISLVAVSASLALALVLPAAAQVPAGAPVATQANDPKAPPPDAPMDIVMPKVAMPSEGWTDADKGDAGAKKATDALKAVQQAYQSAAQLTDTAKLTMKLPDGESKESLDMVFGKGNDMVLKMGSMQVICVNDTINFVPDQPADKYLSKKIGGSLSETLGQMLPGFAIPAPNLALRHPAKGADPVDAFSMGAVKGLKPVGFREKGGNNELLLVGGGAEALVMVDPKTNLVKGYNMVFTPDGLPPSLKLGLEVALSPSTDALKAPVAFDAGKRKAVASIDDLAGEQAAGAGGGDDVKVKVGADAPVMALNDLQGKTVDLGAMKGKVIVLDFWATWCGPCRKGLPLLHQFADEMKSNDKVVVFPVNVWENSKGDELNKKVADFWTTQKFTLRTLLDPEAKLIGQYGFQGIPAFVIIGPDGKLAATHLGYDPSLVDTLKKEVEKALGGAAAK